MDAPSYVSSLDKYEKLEDVKKEKCIDSVSKISKKNLQMISM